MLGLAYCQRYYADQLTRNPESTTLQSPYGSTEFSPEPASPSVPPPSQEEPPPSPPPSQSSSNIIIEPSPPDNSEQPITNLQIGAYSNDPSNGQPQPFGAIDWSADGPIAPGQTRNSSRVYFRNKGTVPVTLHLSTSGWILRDAGGKLLDQNYARYFSVVWDYDSSPVAVGETRPITFSLTISPNVFDVTTFSFDLILNLT